MQARLPYWSIAPKAVAALQSLEAYLNGSAIEPKLAALVRHRVSQINGCAFCLDMHAHELREAGETNDRIDLLPAWREVDVYSERERAALDWAETVTRVSETHVPDAAYEAAREELSDQELVDLTFVVAAINAWNRLAISMRVPPGRLREARPATAA